MSNEPDLFTVLNATHTHRTSIIVTNPKTGEMRAYTPFRKHAKWRITHWHPLKTEYENGTFDMSFREVIEEIYSECDGWRVVTDNSMPGKIETRVVSHKDGNATWYVAAPEHGLALPHRYSVHPCPMQAGQSSCSWYVSGPNDRSEGERTIECIYTSIEDAVDAAWDEVES